MSKTKILIVEDEAIIAEDLRHILESLGYEVVGIAMKYHQAVSILEIEKPDLILLDIIIGGSKTGIDLAEEINRTYKIPFIFLTSHSDSATVQQAKTAKPLGYLVKPFSKDDIYTTLEVALVRSEPPINKILVLLSSREQDVYRALIDGLTDQEIGEKLFISLNTVKTHVKSIYEKLGVKNRLQAVSLTKKRT